MPALLRESVYGRLAACVDVNDAERLRIDRVRDTSGGVSEGEGEAPAEP